MSAKVPTDALDRAARATWRVFTIGELHEFGISRDQVRTMVARGQLHRLHQGIYLYGHPDAPWQAEFLAAQYLGGPGAYLTRGSGLAAMGIWRPYTREIHVTTGIDRRGRRGVVIHRTRVPPRPDELTADGPLRYARLPRLLLELTPVSNEHQLTKLITQGVQQNKLDHALMRVVLERYAGQPGIGLLTAAYAAYLPEPKAKSNLEARFDRELARRPWIPEPTRNAFLEVGGIRWELDRWWPEHGVVVEVDGRDFHTAVADRAKDELKRAKLLTVGIQVLTVSDWRIDYQIADALDDLEAILALRRRAA
jgi:hypothetical protein